MSRCWQVKGVGGTADCERLPEVVHCRNCPEYAHQGRELFQREATGEMLAEWTKALAAPKEQGARQALSLVIFRLRDEWFALPTGMFQEIAEFRAIHRVPFRTGGPFLGLVNVGGELLLCVSLTTLLGLEGEGAEASRPRTCVVRRDRERVAFPVDEVLGVRAVDAGKLGATPATVAKAPTALTTSLFRFEGFTVGLLDGERLFQALSRCLAW